MLVEPEVPGHGALVQVIAEHQSVAPAIDALVPEILSLHRVPFAESLISASLADGTGVVVGGPINQSGEHTEAIT